MIEPASGADLAEILSWLKADYDVLGAGFYCNRNWIERAHDEGNLFIVRHEGNVAAFMAASPEIYEILEVRSKYRKMGFGRALAEFCIERSRAADVSVIEIECSPISSVPFWAKFGFRLIPGFDNRAQLILDRTFELPDASKKIEVIVEFYPECADYKSDVPPSSRHHALGAWVSDEYIQLDRRILVPSHGRSIIRILMNGKQVYWNKLKYQDILSVGVQRRHWTYHLDGIHAAYLDDIDVAL